MAEGFFVVARFGFAEDAGCGLMGWLFALRELFVEGRYALQAGSIGVGGGPLPEEDGAFFLYFLVGERVCGRYAKAFEEGFVDETSLEPGPRVFDKAVEDGKGTKLLVDVAILS